MPISLYENVNFSKISILFVYSNFHRFSSSAFRVQWYASEFEWNALNSENWTRKFRLLGSLKRGISQQNGWEERLWNDLFCVRWDVKPLTQSTWSIVCCVHCGQTVVSRCKAPLLWQDAQWPCLVWKRFITACLHDKTVFVTVACCKHALINHWQWILVARLWSDPQGKNVPPQPTANKPANVDSNIATWQTRQNIMSCLIHYIKAWHHSQKWKYTSYCTVVKGVKFCEVWTSCFWDMQGDRQTDILIAILRTPTGEGSNQYASTMIKWQPT